MTALTIKTPLVDIAIAMLALHRTEEAILRMVDTGELLYVWDIRASGKHRRLLRVCASSVAAAQSGSTDTPDIENAIHQIFPRPFSNFSLPDVARKLLCSSDHVTNLVHARELDSLPGKVTTTNPLRISRPSLVSFLRKRRIT